MKLIALAIVIAALVFGAAGVAVGYTLRGNDKPSAQVVQEPSESLNPRLSRSYLHICTRPGRRPSSALTEA